jgi:hypothetical protein
MLTSEGVFHPVTYPHVKDTRIYEDAREYVILP